MRNSTSADSLLAPATSPRRESDVSLVVTVDEATRLLRIGRTTLYKLMNGRNVTIVKIGGASRILRSSLDEYVKKVAV